MSQLLKKTIAITTLLLTIGLLVSCSMQIDLKQGFIVENDSIRLQVSCLDERTIHVQASPIGSKIKESMVVKTTDLKFSEFEVFKFEKKTSIQTSLIKVEYDATSDKITFIDRKTLKAILSENIRHFTPMEVLGDRAYNVSQTFELSPHEAIYGLGQYQEGILNYRGQTVNMVQANCEIVNPVLLSTKNYLIFWDNYSKTTFTDNNEGATFWSEMGDAVNYYFIYGSNMNDAIVGYRDLTGHVPMLPKSAFGFWMSKERYKSFDELTSVVAEHRKRNIPLDNIVQDWQYWGEDNALWNSMEFSSPRFDNATEVIDKLHNDYHVKLTVSVWPAVGPKTKIYQAMDSANVLFDVPTWAGYKVVDIYSPIAQNIYWDYLNRGLYSKGVDSWWMDATEPSFKDGLYQDKQEHWSKSAGMTHIGPFHRYLATYSLVLSKMMYENLRKQSNKRVSILTRSAFAGQQKYSTSTWSGDIYASWNVFKKQIPAGLNFCMTGIPYWTTDIGGFRVISENTADSQAAGEISSHIAKNSHAEKDGGYKRGLQDPAYLELYTRWFQYGVFNPIFRAHGTEVPREVWQFGNPGTPYYDAQLKMIDLRYSLLSYIYSNAWQVTSEGATMMRALAVDFTNDNTVYDNADGFMFGDALLIYPITHPMYFDRAGKIDKLNTQVSLYLPKHKGNYWFDLNPDRYYEAGLEVIYDAPLDVIPVFVKAGSIVPRNKVVQYANADDNKEMEIVIYAGHDAKFTLYEDDNETYDYEKGEYTTLDITWDEHKQEVNFSEAKGKPKLSARQFNIKVIRAIADGKTSESIKEVLYDNKAQHNIKID